MALDVYIVNPETDEAVYQFGIEDEAHAVVFTDEYMMTRACPQLLKAQEYFDDAKFSGFELECIVRGIDKALPRFTGRADAMAMLRQLRAACAEADRSDRYIQMRGD
ncbi:MAG: hypothetical protein H8E66_35150 [Planctomycetes bacterium]|nr:hypothetical protein [Planctomycetota bacterium]